MSTTATTIDPEHQMLAVLYGETPRRTETGQAPG